MQELYRSNLLQSLGWALADSLWQMSLLWLIYQLFFALPFRQRPTIKHAGAVTMLLAGSIWFLYSFITRFNAESALTPGIASEASEFSLSFTSVLIASLPYLSTAYLLILILLFVRLGWNFASTQRLKTELIPNIEWQHVVDRLTVSMGMSREIFIYISEHINVPSTIGFLKPVILIPVATVNQLSMQQMEAVIIHEMTHIRRYDYLVNLVVAFIETILFFNPFTHLLARAVRKECELCCDDAVIRQQDPEQYAHALLLLEKSKLKPALAMAATGKQGMLLGRVKRILNVPDQEVKYKHKILALVLVAGLIMLTGLFTPSKVSEQDREKTTIAAEQVSIETPERIALPVMMKIKENKSSLPASKAQQKAMKPKTPAPTSPRRSEAQEFKMDMAFTVETPSVPAPPTPPIEPDYQPAYSFVYPAPVAEDVQGYKNTPDPRDKRPRSILKTGAAVVRNHVPYMIGELRNGAYHLEELAKAEFNAAAVQGMNSDLYYKKMMSEDMMRELRRFEGQKKTLESERKTFESERKIATTQSRTKVVPKKKLSKAIVKTIPVENGMTITIIQNEDQIEITLKEKNK